MVLYNFMNIIISDLSGFFAVNINQSIIKEEGLGVGVKRRPVQIVVFYNCWRPINNINYIHLI